MRDIDKVRAALAHGGFGAAALDLFVALALALVLLAAGVMLGAGG